MAVRDLIGAQHRRPGLRRGEGHALAHGRIRGDVEQMRQRARRLAERRMFGDVLDRLAVDEDLPAVAQGAQIFGAGAQGSGGFAWGLVCSTFILLLPC